MKNTKTYTFKKSSEHNEIRDVIRNMEKMLKLI